MKHMHSSGMQLMTSIATGPVVGLLAGSLLIAGSAATALGAFVFTVDPSQSSVSLSGSALGTSLTAQGAGSLTTQYEGGLLVDVGSTAIQFPGQSLVVALDSGNWQPLSDGSVGSAPANYGATFNCFFTSGVAAARDIQVDVTSGALPLVNGAFDTQGITVSVPAAAPSVVAYRVEGSINDSGAVALAGESATGQVAQGSLVTVGSQLVLTIPINYTFVYSVLSANDTALTLTGQVLATSNL
jgi:hypothetical protein